MAQNDNTGTTGGGSQPQGNDGTSQIGSGDNSNQGRDADGNRLIAGKWKTVEEAVEHGYGGLEQKMHQLTEQVGGLVRIMEAVMDPASQGGGGGGGGGGGYAPVGQGGGGGNYGGNYNYNNYDQEGYGRDGRGGGGGGGGYDQRQDPDYIDPANFVVNPTQHLRQREERMLQRVNNMVATTVSNVVANASIVNDFKSRNPDLLAHELTVQGFMRNLDQRIPLAKRLDMAAKQTRDYIGSIKGSGGGSGAGNNPAPNSAQYVESPRGPGGSAGSAGGPGGGSGSGSNSNEGIPLSEIDSEEGLAEYIRERNNTLGANYGYGYTPPKK